MVGFDGKNWMENLPSDVKNSPINTVFMPGTHNSGTYQVKTDLLPLECFWAKVGESVSCLPCVKNIITDTMEFQNQTISEQLEIGIRYFDIRYSWSPNTSALYASHQFAGDRIESIFSSIFSFLGTYKNEAVVLRVTRDQYHNHNKYGQDEKIQELALETFDKMLVKKEDSFEKVSLTNMIQNDKRIILIFDEKIENLNEYFWPGSTKKLPFTSLSDPTEKFSSLKDDVSNLEAKSTRFNGLQFTLTPQTGDYFKRSGYSSLMVWRQSMQVHLPGFLKTEAEAMKQKNICIIQTDFPTSKFVEAIVNLNHN